MAFTFKDFKNRLSEKQNDLKISIHSTWNGENNPCIWISYNGINATERCHYEFNADGGGGEAKHQKNRIYVEVHFEDTNWKSFEKKIEKAMPINGLFSFPWVNETMGIRIDVDGVDMNVDVNDAIDDAIKKLKELDEKVGKIIKQTMTEITIKEIKDLLKKKKNIILQGAPGVGKTYTTAALALRICEETVKDWNNHSDVMKRYEQLQKKGRIGFCTFHQSFDYEDFVEGIKPQIIGEDDRMVYKVEDGIFKKLCKNATNPQKVKQTKMLEFAFDDLLQDIIDGNVKKLKFKNGNTTTELSVSTQQTIKWKTGNGDLDVNCVSKERLLKLCEIYDSKKKIEGMTNITESIRNVIGDCNTSYYWAVINYLFDKIENYVLIIDEINRGNVSKIFGELITLLEADKRIGGEHPIKVTLPYSKDEFGVPSNLYIIGTMNTTDRSVGNIDYAVRRRFAFVTIEANESVLKNDCHQKDLFSAVNNFVEANNANELDLEDLKVGHSFFMVDSKEDLQRNLKYEIIPLIKEYIKDGLLKSEGVETEITKWNKIINNEK